MKKQINIGNGNSQKSYDSSTMQVQIGLSKNVFFSIIAVVLIGYLVLTYFI